ncbi:MAG: glycosyl hydrolase family 95 catalytic domain-containing protein, partial [Flavisolibacter sp.]
SWLPAANWEHALLTGNGTVGAMVIGQPHDETIILSHALLYLPRKRSGKIFQQAEHLPLIRKLLLEGKYAEAAKLPDSLRKAQGYFDERDPFIPAFDIRVIQEPSNISRYQRSVNFETGEAIVEWQDDIGIFKRSTFVSRADSLVVIRIKGSAKINCRIYFDRRPMEWTQQAFVNEHIMDWSAQAFDKELHYSTSFRYLNDGQVQGFEGVGKVFTKNGFVIRLGNQLVVNQADEVLFLVRISPRYETDELNPADFNIYLDPDYEALLKSHTTIHRSLFNQVQFSLDADPAEKNLHTEEILLKAKTSVPLALIEKTFDAGRYNIISSTGTHPPNLQGLWTGTWASPWAGSMTHDGNLPVAISFLLPGNTPELMQAYFSYHENLLPQYRLSAQQLYGTRGIHIPAQATTAGVETDFNETWCLTLWTGAAGWAASYYWDYYQYTLDMGFLKGQAYPFMKEALLFYEDFLTKDERGIYIFNPSYSPENNPSNNKSQAAVNATMDIMIAKKLLRDCIAASELLKGDKAERIRWKEMLQSMPAYEIGPDGSLREWLWKDLQENHRHRHVSQLYALFDETAPEFVNDEKLRAAALKVLDEKMKFRKQEGGGEMAFGLVQLGLAAAHLGDKEKCAQLVDWLASKYWSTSMGSFHNVGHLFNTDISGGLPYLVSQMLVNSVNGGAVFFPAKPTQWEQGQIKGLLLRGNVWLKELSWNKEKISITVNASVLQSWSCYFPFEVEWTGKKTASPKKSKDRWVVLLPAGEDVQLEFKKTM